MLPPLVLEGGANYTNRCLCVGTLAQASAPRRCKHPSQALLQTLLSHFYICFGISILSQKTL